MLLATGLNDDFDDVQRLSAPPTFIIVCRLGETAEASSAILWPTSAGIAASQNSDRRADTGMVGDELLGSFTAPTTSHVMTVYEVDVRTLVHNSPGAGLGHPRQQAAAPPSTATRNPRPPRSHGRNAGQPLTTAARESVGVVSATRRTTRSLQTTTW